MPWDVALKRVVRANTDFTGSDVWLQDKQANIKIIAQRHDTHDEDLAQAITACLNLDGINAMRAHLDMDTHSIINLVAGAAATDAVNFAQLEAVQADADAAQADADAALAAIAGLPATTQIVAQSWNGTTFTSDRLGGADLTTTISLISNLRVGGLVLHKAAAGVTGSVAVTSADHRYRVTNNGALTVTFTVPSATDSLLGTNFVMEGNILFTNGASAAGITLTMSAGGALTADEVIGAPTTTNGDKYMLSYFIHYHSGTWTRLMVWTS